MPADFLEKTKLRGTTEGNDFHGNGEKSAELRGEFGFIDNDDLAFGCLGHNLLVKEGSASALDEIQSGINLVGSIDGEIDALRAGGWQKRKTGFLGEAADDGRGGEARLGCR